MTPLELKALAQTALEDLKGIEIIAIDVADRTTVTDWMIVAGGTSQRHVKSLANAVSDTCKENGVRPLGTEGEQEGDWVLVDLGDVIVHVMTSESRDFYALEKLWTMEPADREAQAHVDKASEVPDEDDSTGAADDAAVS